MMIAEPKPKTKKWQPRLRAEWERAEDAFRLMAFQVYYQHGYSDEKDLVVRFAKAIVASSWLIADHAAVLAWFRARQASPTGRVDPQVVAQIASQARGRRLAAEQRAANTT